VTNIGLIAPGGTTTGNERYMLELTQALLRRNDGFSYTVFYTNESARDRITEHQEKANFRKVRAPTRWLRQAFTMPRAVRRSSVDLVHSQYGLLAFTQIPGVVMVPDAYFAHHPEHHPRVQRLQLGYRVPHALRRARRVIVPSEATKQDLMDLYRVTEGKLRVIPHGVAHRFQPLPDTQLDRVREQYRLPESFILYVGALQPRKNLVRLVAAFGGLSAELRRLYPLVLSGAERWMYDDLQSAARPFVAEGTLRFLGFADDRDLPALMNLATVFAFPSLSEGFGFPVVEAMRCGTCVLAGRAGSLPEVVRDGGLLVDPLSVEDIRTGLRRLLDDGVLRARLAHRGRTLAQEFDWDRTAAQTVQIYREALNDI
jgi:glycosyltransferase involved in cell wall biosynthesis